MKDYKRLGVGVAMFNSPNGYVILDVQEYDGGMFELHPKLTDEGSIVLTDPNRPATYALEIKGSPEALRKLGTALVRLSRDAATSDDDNDTAV